MVHIHPYEKPFDHRTWKNQLTTWIEVKSNVECITQRSIKDSIVKKPIKSEYLDVKCL